jgi:hypothetical protein
MTGSHKLDVVTYLLYLIYLSIGTQPGIQKVRYHQLNNALADIVVNNVAYMLYAHVTATFMYHIVLYKHRNIMY